MIDVIINDISESLPDETTVDDIIKNKNYKNVIVWINANKLLKNDYSKKIIKNGDNIKIVRVFGGG